MKASSTYRAMTTAFLVLIVHLEVSNCANDWLFAGTNFALNKFAEQYPGTFSNFTTADRAVDGNKYKLIQDGIPPNTTCSHTLNAISQAANWSVNINLTLFITGIKIYNRDAKEKIRLKNFQIFGSNQTTIRAKLYDDEGKNTFEIERKPIKLKLDLQTPYSIITVEIPPNNNTESYLTLCEVEIYGDSRTCQADELWDGSTPNCTIKFCNLPRYIKFGRYDLANTDVPELSEYNTTIDFLCDMGYNQTSGPQRRTCNENSTWSGNEPECSPKECIFPINISYKYHINNALAVNGTGHIFYNEIIEVTCKSTRCNLTVPPVSRRCTHNGTLDSMDPECAKEDTTHVYEGAKVTRDVVNLYSSLEKERRIRIKEYANTKVMTT